VIISIVTPEDSWMRSYSSDLRAIFCENHEAFLADRHEQIPDSDVTFYLGYDRIVPSDHLARHKNNIVVHESALPAGRGMSPMTWQILEGVRDIPVTLFEAVEALDAGSIYLKSILHTQGNELLPELREALAAITLKMCREFIARYPDIVFDARPQVGAASYYRRRRPRDSMVDPTKTIEEQFDLLRVVDNDRYPAFFELRGRVFRLAIEPMDES